jgi:potassium/chloride transporter 4/5/6
MALWFPAVTGIMAGSNRSADLKNPAGSIPKGTLTSQLSTSVIYLSFVVLFGCVAPRQNLLDDSFFAATSAWPAKEVVMYGVMASTIGAGLTSLVSGTRLLSAIAADKTLPVLSIFAAKPGKEPRLALLASGALCACAIAIGQLNAVAPVLTMFFLMCYTCVNLSVTILQAVHDPNWRPRFRYYHWSVSLFGAILCVWMMFAIDWIYALVAMLFCLLVFVYATHNSHQVKWGDGFQGMKFQLAKNILLHIDTTMHTKNWRPQILVLTGASSETEKDRPLILDEPKLLDFVAQLKGGRGITIVGAVCAESEDAFGHGGPFVSTGQHKAKRTDGTDALDVMLHERQIKGFSKLVHTKNFNEGVSCLAQIVGLGAFQPNCVMSAWPDHWQDPAHGEEARKRFIHTVQTVVELQKAMLVVKGVSFPGRDVRLTGNIDIWWIVADGGMLLLLPFLLKQNKVWQSCQVRLFAIARQEDDPESVRNELKAYMQDFRLDVEVHVKVVNGELLSGVSYMTKADVDGITSAISAADVPRSVSASLFPTWRRNATDLEPVAPQRVHSAVLPMFSQAKLPFPEQPPCGSGQIVKVDIDTSAPLTSGVADPPTQLPSCRSIPGEREVLPSPRTPVSVHIASPELPVTASLEEEELALAAGLNDIIRSESGKADLVLTNLPDMPPGVSSIGYFELVEKLTSSLPRCLLVRGTATEVITAFT